MKTLRTSIALAAAMLLALSSANAGYNANVSVHITRVLTYDSSQFILVTDNTPSISGCGGYFSVVIPDAEARNRLYAIALTAMVTNQSINIGYDSASSACAATGYTPVYEIG